MEDADLEKLGLNRNEAKVYHALFRKGEATAQEIVKFMGIHRNIIYDNLERLVEKGLVSFVNIGNKRRFIAEKPSAIIEFLESRKESLDKEIATAKGLIPKIGRVLGASRSAQDVSLFRGIGGLKKVLSEIVQADESWCIGVTNESVKILGETFWKNYNQKKKETKTKERLLWNSNFVNTVIGENPRSKHRRLPRELDQVTETILFNDKAAIFVFSKDPTVVLIENKEIFNTWKTHFEFLWRLSKKISRNIS